MKKILSLIIIITFIIFAASCSSEDKTAENDSIKIYYSNAMSDGSYTIDNLNETYCIDLINQYNNDCKNDDNFKRIEVVEFDNEEAMLSKLSSELMAGTGPDIIFSSTVLPYEKLISMDMFADINEILEYTDINIDDYNKIVMDSGCINGKRFFLPLFYTCENISTLNSKLEKYQIEKDSIFTFDNLDYSFNQYLQKADIPFYAEYVNRKEFVYNIVSEYVDFENKLYNFDDKSLKSTLDTAFKLMNAGLTDVEENTEDSLFSKYCGGLGFLDTCAYYSSILENQDEVVIFNDISETGTNIKATVQLGIAINNNSTQKEYIANFMSYVLSEEVQDSFCGGDIEEYNEGYNMGVYLPVNNSSLAKLIETGVTLSYGDDTVQIQKQDVELYITYINNINVCDIGINDYYEQKILDELVDDFLKGNINTEKFIEQIKIKSELYFGE